MARPKRQEARRTQLMEAARRAVVERGLAELRLGDVARQAGLSPGSVLYYFPTLPDLLQEVQREAIGRFCTAREQAVRDEPDPRRRLLAMIRSGLPEGPGDELAYLLYELGAFARKDPAYAARYIDLYHRQVAIYVGILEAGAAAGVFRLAGDALGIARNLVILEDGYGLHMTMAVPTFHPTDAERQIIAYAAIATGCDLT
ncbi:TetR/AcrR family transcriptional regulator [Kibdelosporangium persicum]|uniref:DNA-binding transcriptional regulator YbjK n=1 Tax=Kibdelosporangium persicum TaxID=2698649 RepID=A0ABX2F6E7_9PSEU|nr:TetR/AcrR family transcriptional regulator [Kibdelosporangium persicum]NRN66941.1 DNA-binding transcriptional regulator YbjK [Kibdelosporangium persicum]